MEELIAAPLSFILLFLQNAFAFVMFCAIWYYLCNLKNVKNTHGGVLLLVTLFHECFLRFLNCTIGTKSRKTYIH